MVPLLDMDSLGPCRRLRAGKLLLDNSVCACVHAYFPPTAVTCFSSIPPWFFLPIPTAHAHTVYIICVRRVIVSPLIHFALCIVVVSHPNPFPFWPPSFIRRTISCPLSITLTAPFFLSA